MTEVARREATYQDLLNAPKDVIAEILDGELVLHPRPAPPHTKTASTIMGMLYPLSRRRGNAPGGWHILIEPEIHLQHPREITVPDVAGWRRERLPHLPSKSTLLTTAPDWICEVISPSTARDDRTRKMSIYARNGVSYLWLVDPIVQVLEVYELGGQFYQRLAGYTGNEPVTVVPFLEIELDLAEWWAEQEEPESDL